MMYSENVLSNTISGLNVVRLNIINLIKKGGIEMFMCSHSSLSQ